MWWLCASKQARCRAQAALGTVVVSINELRALEQKHSGHSDGNLDCNCHTVLRVDRPAWVTPVMRKVKIVANRLRSVVHACPHLDRCVIGSNITGQSTKPIVSALSKAHHESWPATLKSSGKFPPIHACTVRLTLMHLHTTPTYYQCVWTCLPIKLPTSNFNMPALHAFATEVHRSCGFVLRQRGNKQRSHRVHLHSYALRFRWKSIQVPQEHAHSVVAWWWLY